MCSEQKKGVKRVVPAGECVEFSVPSYNVSRGTKQMRLSEIRLNQSCSQCALRGRKSLNRIIFDAK